MKGTIHSLDARGFGFAKGDDTALYFFHTKSLPAGLFDALKVGDLVTFTPAKHPFKGPRAAGLQRRAAVAA